MDYIKQNLEEITNNISAAAKKSGRRTEDILLIGVTKTIDDERINSLLNLGITDFGENRVQELLRKYESIGTRPNWHLIGHLQTNKVKLIIGKVKLIHSVDSIKLLEEIDKHSSEKRIKTDVLIEINIANEESKYGISPENIHNFFDLAQNFSNICIKGLMTVAPYVENKEENRVFFRKMRNLFIDISEKSIDNVNMEFLSMGMTGDYEVAIEEGSNIVRIGTGLFGARTYTKA